ncbi:MAG: cation diffusion facilitator family transporter [Cytophagaceae bacterium]
MAHTHHKHGHNHDHHHHDHGHSHVPAHFGLMFLVGIVLNIVFVAAEVIYGISSGSMALVADAVHNFGDVLSLIVAWVAFMLSSRKPTSTHTYGFRRTTILAALLNSFILLMSLGIIGWEAFMHLRHPAPVASDTIMAVAGIGILINGVVALMFFRDRKNDINIRSAFQHMAVDALISLGVVLGGLAIRFTSWYWIDPLISLIIVAIVLVSTWKLFMESFHFALDAVPRNIDYLAVKKYLAEIEGVEEVHDLHIWGVSTTETALTVHLFMPAGVPDDRFIFRLGDEIHHHFGIGHSTIQVENSLAGEGHLGAF